MNSSNEPWHFLRERSAVHRVLLEVDEKHALVPETSEEVGLVLPRWLDLRIARATYRKSESCLGTSSK